MINSTKKSLKSSNGITLIALVVTIIVLLILAGISISMLSGDNGLLKKAGQAKEDSIVGEEKEQVELAYISAAVKNLGGNVTGQNLQDELDASVGINKTEVSSNEGSSLNVCFVNTNHNYNVNNGKVAKVKDSTTIIQEFSISGTPVLEANIPMPNGFTHTEGTRDTGYVIKDSNGNEFVWIPVDKNQKITVKIKSDETISSVVLTDPCGVETTLRENVQEYNNSEIQPTINGPYRLVVTCENGKIEKKFLYVHSLYAIDSFTDLYATEEFARSLSYLDEEDWEEKNYQSLQEMLEDFGCSNKEDYMFNFNNLNYSEEENYRESIENNGGFYIGRYEATYNNGNAESKKATVDNTRTDKSSTLENGMVWNYIPRSVALEKSKAFNEKASLPTRAAFDRTLGWIYETKNKNLSQIVCDYDDWGWKCYENYESNRINLIKTGSLEKTKANNIFDLARKS